jgi:hypothetical protein
MRLIFVCSKNGSFLVAFLTTRLITQRVFDFFKMHSIFTVGLDQNLIALWLKLFVMI